MNDGVGERAKKADTVAMEGNMRFGWVMKITSLRSVVGIMALYTRALLMGSVKYAAFKECFTAVNAA